MTHDNELNNLMQAIAEKSLQVINDLKDNPEHITSILKQFIELTEHVQNVLNTLLNNPEKAWQMQLSYWEQAMNLAQSQFSHWLEGKSLPMDDRRFNSDEWLNNPFFNLMSHQYLLASEHMSELLEQLEYEDPSVAKRIRFFSKQYLDALSPANFLHTNPQIMAETVQTHGKNLLQGLHNLLSDLEKGSAQLNIKMTDAKAFKIGENLATTPGKVIFRNEMIELIQYTPTTAQTRAVPLLIVPPWINKYYILDLSPHNSLIGWLVNQGLTVFVISWINPDGSFADKGLFDYLEEGPKRAIQVIKKQLTVSQVNTLGFCIGGTLLATLLAYNKAQQDNSIKSATFLATMMDFSDPGDLAVFIDEQQIQKIEQEMASKGYLSGKYMASSFNSLRANDLVWSFFIKNYLQGKNPAPFDILYWNSDSTNMPATMHSQYLRWMYLQNDLIKPGKIQLNNTPIDLSQIKIPTFFLSTEKDHIAPWKTTFNGFQIMKGPKQFVLGGSGHIAGIINPPSAMKYGYRTNSNNQLNAEDWFAKSKSHQGSWWPEWLKWLNKYSGDLINAPELDHLVYSPLMDAPGSYVLRQNC
ncbi:alpha/beta hydrolase [Legionella sp. km772]|uniref:PHA/PHB synthase family protein n=1 Tax=Legionella sp. km772 TaxID=2498111 RepID=UPI000F8E0AF0|nr:class I poly(R)-hydroxyalkanoic acid synthase [Legionella sp. km772]RUR12419.1 class I poly(R)-hydroxyalkanoic acid synthase [Legionella sp. km772]